MELLCGCGTCREEQALREAARMSAWRLLEQAGALCEGCCRAVEARVDHDLTLVAAAEALHIYGCACP